MALRTRKPRDQRTIQGAATRLPTGDKDKLRKSIQPPVEWQNEAWEFYDTVPELKFGTGWAGNLCAKVKLYVATLNAEGNAVAVSDEASGISSSDAAQLDLLMDELAGDFGGQADIQRELTMNLDVAGECYLVGWAPDVVAAAKGAPVDADNPQLAWRWEVRSISEVVKVQGGGTEVLSRRTDKRGRVIRVGVDEAIRCWVRHPRWSEEADAATMALTTDFRSLQVLSQQIMAESMSRASAPLLLVPASIRTANGAGGDDPRRDAPPDDDDPGEGDFVSDLTAHVTNPIADPADPSSVVPLVGIVPDHILEKDLVKVIDLARQTGEQTDKRIQQRVDRVARGLNMPVEVIMGHRQTTFANADQVSQDEFTDFLEPRILLQADLLTVGYLRPIAADRGVVAPEVLRKVFVWYDADELQDPPDLGEAADDARAAFTISDAAYRRAKGFTDEDAPTPEEQMRQLALTKAILTADIAGALLQQYVDPSFTPPVAPAPGAGPTDAQATTMALMAVLAQQARHDRALAAALAAAGYDLPHAQPVTAAIDAHGRDEPGHPR